jgi:hypothetical protein
MIQVPSWARHLRVQHGTELFLQPPQRRQALSVPTQLTRSQNKLMLGSLSFGAFDFHYLLWAGRAAQLECGKGVNFMCFHIGGAFRLSAHQHLRNLASLGREILLNMACTECRRRKLRCDGQQPRCSNCESTVLVCETSVRHARGPKRGHMAALRKRIGSYFFKCDVTAGHGTD